MPDEKVFCRKCGAKIYAGAKICSNCGVKQFIQEKKNPIQALILSALVVGLGQIYNQDYWKGIILIASMVLIVHFH
jgi:ribosomal protein L40E